jgi:hypothetical protein
MTPGSGEVELFRRLGTVAAAPGSKVADGATKVTAPKASAPKMTVLTGAPSKPSSDGHIFWDRRTGDLLSGAGDVLAYALPEAALPAALDRAGAYQRLVALGAGRLLDVSIAPPDRAFVNREQFAASIEGLLAATSCSSISRATAPSSTCSLQAMPTI